MSAPLTSTATGLPVFGPTGVQNVHDDAPVPFAIVRVDFQVSHGELFAALVLGFTETDPDGDPAGLSVEDVHQLVEATLADTSGLELTKFEEHLRTGQLSREQLRINKQLRQVLERAYDTATMVQRTTVAHDGPFVAPALLRNDDGTLTVPTVDHGLLRLDCPYWCTDGHNAPARAAKADICHRSEPIWGLSVTDEYGEAGHLPVSFLQFPFRDNDEVYLVVEDQPDGDLEFGPAGARQVAAALRAHADVIDGMATELEQIRGAGR